MPVFLYSAIDPDTKKTISGQLEATDARTAKEMIRQQGHIPTELDEDESVASVENILAQLPFIGDFFAPKCSLKEITIMTQQLHTLLDAGIPLIQALYLLEQQGQSKRMREVMKSIRADVIAGDSFSMAMKRFPREFDKLYLNMIKAGETSGSLDHICARLGVLLEKQMELKAKVQGALIMPAVTFVVIVGVIILILTVVVPMFSEMFSSRGKELPLPTVILIETSNFMMAYWWALIAAGIVITTWFSVYFVNGVGRPLLDQWMLTTPLFGDLLKKMYVSSFVRTLATLTGSGVALTEGIITSAQTVDNFVMQNAFDSARESINLGGSLSGPLEKSNTFPPIVVKMIAIGEETGQLENMMNKAAGFLDKEVDAAVDNLTKMIEPAMIVILGGILLGVALALYIPLFQMATG